MILELAVALRCSPSELRSLDDDDLATLVDVLAAGGRR